MLDGKKILVGITGGISAYKTASLIRLLVKAGAEVRAVMSSAAKEFVSPLTIATLTKNPVYTDFYNPENGEWHSHVKLGIWADLYVIAPATANTIAKIAHGIADNLLLTTVLSARCKVMVAPAMDVDMYQNPVTRQNSEILRSRGFLIAEAAEGELASGLSGKGRMAEPEDILAQIELFFAQTQDFKGKKILVTAGPTREKIDPVRFVSNYSTGKMGYALAECLAARGAEVVLVSGPVDLKPHNANISLVSVESAKEMCQACVEHFPQCHAAIMTAAVADYAPKEVAPEKIKKNGETEMILTLVPNPDIAATLGRMKTQNQVLAGFALETENEMTNAQKKLESKNFDFIVLNSLKDKGAGFGCDTNKISIVWRDGRSENFDLKPKTEVARDIAHCLLHLLK